MASAGSQVADGQRAGDVGRPGRRLALLFGLAVGLVGAMVTLSPAGQAIEENIGLKALFEVRGQRPPPAGTVIVSIDGESARRLSQPDRIRNWDRRLYAAAIDLLTERGASVIVFDIILEDDRDPAMDAALAASIERSGRVVLFQRLTRDELGDRTVPPHDRFADRARGLGTFALPKIPARVSFFWPFFPTVTARDTAPEPGTPTVLVLRERASLPVAAFHVRLLDLVGEERLRSVLDDSGIGASVPVRNGSRPQRLSLLIDDIRRAFRDRPDASTRLLDSARSQFASDPAMVDAIATLARIHASRGERFLNFYGPPRTIDTIPLTDLLSPPADDAGAPPAFAGRVVFFGGSDVREVDQVDGFRTVFSTADGLDLSGVEIAATAYANITDDSLLRPARRIEAVLAVLAFGLLTGYASIRLRGGRAVAVAGLIASAWFGAASLAFSAHAHWMPVVVPIGIELPGALFGGLFWQYLTARRERNLFHRGIRYYAPEDAIRKLVDSGGAVTDAEVMYFTCMVSDVAGYTSLAERTGPQRLARLTNEYFAVLGEDIRAEGGEMLFIDGDSQSSVWRAADADRQCRLKACRAAIRIRDDVDRFNRGHASTPFVTRIGLHAGWLAIGNVGGGGRFTYTVVGDIVNTASRIEGLNKLIGTRLLAAAAVTDGLDELLLRPVGRFVLKGKTQAIDIVEIVDERTSASDERYRLCHAFAEALALFRHGSWRLSASRFRSIDGDFCGDGPSRFYAALCDDYGTDPQLSPADGVIHVSTK